MTAKSAWYAMSKQLSEKLAWRLAEKKNLDLQLAVMNPCLMLGPVLDRTEVHGQKGDSRGKLNTSVATLVKYFDGTFKEIPRDNKCIVDVRDVAAAHIAPLERKGIWAHRHPLIAECPDYEEIVTCVRKSLKKMDMSAELVPRDMA